MKNTCISVICISKSLICCEQWSWHCLVLVTISPRAAHYTFSKSGGGHFNPAYLREVSESLDTVLSSGGPGVEIILLTCSPATLIVKVVGPESTAQKTSITRQYTIRNHIYCLKTWDV